MRAERKPRRARSPKSKAWGPPPGSGPGTPRASVITNTILSWIAYPFPFSARRRGLRSIQCSITSHRRQPIRSPHLFPKRGKKGYRGLGERTGRELGSQLRVVADKLKGSQPEPAGPLTQAQSLTGIEEGARPIADEGIDERRRIDQVGRLRPLAQGLLDDRDRLFRPAEVRQALRLDQSVVRAQARRTLDDRQTIQDKAIVGLGLAAPAERQFGVGEVEEHGDVIGRDRQGRSVGGERRLMSAGECLGKGEAGP